ncbi:MAG: polysaccharide deacetylase family protein [Hyphomicrobium sp.]|nr:polysaccharide deacetylase family protein [Hyphomicrobium sp.]
MRNGLKNAAGIIAAGTLALMALALVPVRAENGQSQPEPNGVSADVRVDACASDPSLLGLSRVVEIDTAGGPQFGGGHGHASDFLKDGEVILTFDDGPLRPYTRPVLKALAAHCTKATFFMVGRMAASDPAMVKEVGASGHTVASHTWSHQNLKPIGLFKARQEFEMGYTAVNKALGRQATPFFRFPYLSENRQVLEHLKKRNVSALWVDVDSKDYQTRDPKIVHRRIMAELKAKRKGIILMHDIQPSTAGAIKGLLDELHEKGFKVVHIVPKTSVDTIAAYDGAVDQTFNEKAEAAAANPMAKRSLVWSMAPPPADGATGARKPVTNGATAAAKSPPAVPAAVVEELPWLKAGNQAPARAQASPAAAGVGATAAVSKPQPAKPAKPKAEVLPWQPQLFGY